MNIYFTDDLWTMINDIGIQVAKILDVDRVTFAIHSLSYSHTNIPTLSLIFSYPNGNDGLTYASLEVTDFDDLEEVLDEFVDNPKVVWTKKGMSLPDYKRSEIERLTKDEQEKDFSPDEIALLKKMMAQYKLTGFRSPRDSLLKPLK